MMLSELNDGRSKKNLNTQQYKVIQSCFLTIVLLLS